MAKTIEWTAYASAYADPMETAAIFPSGTDSQASPFVHMFARAVGATGPVVWGMRWEAVESWAGPPELAYGWGPELTSDHQLASTAYKVDPYYNSTEVRWLPPDPHSVCVRSWGYLGTVYLTAAGFEGELFVTYMEDGTYPTIAWGTTVVPAAPEFWTEFQNAYEIP